MNRKHIAVFLTILFILGGCQTPNTSPSSEPSPPVSATYTPTKPDEEKLLDPDYWLNNVLPLSIYAFQPNFERGEVVHAYNVPYFYISHWLAQTGQYAQYHIRGIDAVMPLDDYFYYVEKFFGAVNVDESLYVNGEFSGLVDTENRTIILWEPDGYDRVSGSYDVTKRFSGVLGRIKIESITPYFEDGKQKVKLVLEEYETDEHLVINRLETYVFYWDDAVGFVGEESNWRWPVTDRVSVEGDPTLFEQLWNIAGDPYLGHLPYGMDSLNLNNELFVVGGKVYRFSLDKNLLRADRFDFTTGTQATDQIVYDFGTETVLRQGPHGEGIVVYTSAAAYRFDETLELEIRQAWPASLLGQLENVHTLNHDLTMAALSVPEGVSLCAMQPDAAPVLLKQTPPSESVVEKTYYFPIFFVDDERLFTGISGWEEIRGFEVLDLQGRIVEEIPLVVSGMLGGGNCVANRESAIFFHPIWQDTLTNYYYDFASATLEEIDWLLPYKDVQINRCLPSTQSPGVWYMSGSLFSEGTTADRTIFVRLDFNNRTAAELPLKVVGAQAALLAVGEQDELLFAYGYKDERGFGLYQAPELL